MAIKMKEGLTAGMLARHISRLHLHGQAHAKSITNLPSLRRAYKATAAI